MKQICHCFFILPSDRAYNAPVASRQSPCLAVRSKSPVDTLECPGASHHPSPENKEGKLSEQHTWKTTRICPNKFSPLCTLCPKEEQRAPNVRNSFLRTLERARPRALPASNSSPVQAASGQRPFPFPGYRWWATTPYSHASNRFRSDCSLT